MFPDKFWLSAVVASTVLCAGAVVPASAANEAADDGSFFESFDKLDLARWYQSDGWSNGSFQACTWSKDLGTVKDGMLTLQLTDKASKDRAYSCGEIQTKQRFGYGTYEVRMRAAAGSGVNSSIFTFSGPPAKTPHDEVDFEFLGKDSSKVQLNYYVNAKGGHEFLAPVPGGADKDFHIYSFIWQPDSIRWFIDGKFVHQELPKGPWPTHPGKIFLSLWNGAKVFNGWLGPFTYPGQPITASYDWVAFTPAGVACKFPDSILCKPH